MDVWRDSSGSGSGLAARHPQPDELDRTGPRWRARIRGLHPLEVAVWAESRIHVRCTEASDGSDYFALSTRDPDVDRVLSILQTAISTGTPLGLAYSVDSAENPEGCLVQDCRKIRAVSLHARAQ